MEERTKVHVGLDVHKDSITVAAAEPGREKARLIGKVAHDVPKLLKVLAKLGSVETLHIVYEAGPTGYGLQRELTARGYVCEVIAPSKTPRQSGNRVKTDARDSPWFALLSIHVLDSPLFAIRLYVLDRTAYETLRDVPLRGCSWCS